MTIEDLQALNLDKISHPSLKESVENILEDYAEEKQENRAEFVAQEQSNMETVYKLIKQKSPEAIPGNEKQEQEAPIKKEATQKSTEKSVKKKLTTEELETFEEQIKHCRTALKEYNAKKREGQPEKPKPKRHEKIEKYLLAIGNLVPDTLKDNLDVLEQTEKTLSKTGREIMKLYRMDELHIKEVQEEIKEKYHQKEEKIKKDNDE